MRVATWNVQDGVAATNVWERITKFQQLFLHSPKKEANLHRIGKKLLDREVDVALLQEVDGGSIRSGGKNQLDRIVQGGLFDDSWYIECDRETYTYFGKTYACQGNAVAVRGERILETRQYNLPGDANEKRKVGEAIVRYEGKPLVLLTTHFSLKKWYPTANRNANREAQFRKLTQIIKGHRGKQIVLGGDFNAYDYREIKEFLDTVPILTEVVGDQRTHTFWKKPFDHLFVSLGLQTRDVRVENTGLSDHYMVSADVYRPGR